MIYLDHAATTPLDPRVLDAMLPYLREAYGNASSVHALGRKARHAVEDARERAAACLGAEPAEIVFTSGATEADNAAVFGMPDVGDGRLVTSSTEHEAILRPAEALARDGVEVEFLSPAPSGIVPYEDVRARLDEDVALVSLMAVNNETGAANPVAKVAAACRERGIPLHTDAVQAFGLAEPRVDELGVDLLSLSAHKLYGPKGCGLLFVRGGVGWRPLLRGGSQERGRRGGTEPVASIVGFAVALELAVEEGPARRRHLRGLQARLRDGLEQALDPPFLFNTPNDPALSAAHILNVSFPPSDGRPVDGEMLLLNMDMQGICVSSGSACTSGAIEPSHVLRAMGRDRATAEATVRFSFGKDTSEDEVDRTVEALAGILRRMRRR